MKKVLNQPNLVGAMMIALLVGAGFVYAFAFDGFNVETVPGAEVEAWIAQADGGNYGGGEGEGDWACTCDNFDDKRKRCDGCTEEDNCNNKTKQYPCSNKCEARNSHSGKTPDCSCMNNPYEGRIRDTWSICKKSTSNPCTKKYTKNRKCNQGKT